MEVIIHGTKGGGGKIFYQTTNAPSSMIRDLRRNCEEDSVGRMAYSIEFTSTGCAFTKYIIVRDIRRNREVGYVAFSVFCSNDKKWAGSDIKKMLDDLLDYYSQYIPNYNLDTDNEDWSFVNAAVLHYKSKSQKVLPEDIQIIQPGTSEGAYVSYDSEPELQNYFDDPYLEEYKQFKQIYFVDSNLSGKPENPLNALRHNPESKLSRLDLENPEYTLKYNNFTSDGVKIEVQVNGRYRKSNSKFRKNNLLRIIYSKSNCLEVSEEGRWYTIDPKYISLDPHQQTITIKEVNLLPITKTITFEVKVKNIKSRPINNAEITVINIGSDNTEYVYNNEITFIGSQLKNKYSVTGKKDNWTNEPILIIPENESKNLSLILDRLKVRFNVKDEKGIPISGFSIKANRNVTKLGNTEIELFGNEIDKPVRITISHNKYEEKTFTYRPGKDENPKNIELKESQILDAANQYTVGNGKKNESFYAKFKFILIGLIGIITIFILFTVFLLSEKNQQSQAQDKTQEIINYCSGNELNEQTLREYKHDNCDEESTSQDTLKVSMWSKLLGLESKKKHKTESMPYYCQVLDNALAIRNAINLGSIHDLKNLKYSDSQNTFKDAVNSIEVSMEQQIDAAMRMEGISTMNLSDVTNFIQKLQSILKIDIESLQSEIDCDKKIREIERWNLPDMEIVNNIKSQINNKKETLKQIEEKQSDKRNSSSSSNRYSSPQTETKPKPTTLNPPAASQNSLKDDFWSLVHNGNVTKQSYNDLIRKYKNNKNLSGEENDILFYLNRICRDSETFKKFKDIPELDRRVASTLTSISID